MKPFLRLLSHRVIFLFFILIGITTRIDFEDDQGRQYSIFCSATADNSIMTNWPFFSRSPEYYNFQLIDKKSIRLAELETGDDSQSARHSHTSKASFTTKAGKASLGYSAVPMDL